MNKRYLVSLTIPTSLVESCTAALDPYTDSTSVFEATPEGTLWTITAVLKPDCDRAALAGMMDMVALAHGIDARPAITPLENKDWLAQARQDFPPFRIGSIFLHGSHYKPVPGQGPIRLLVDAGTAFGSGEHPTTRGCLLALQALAKRIDDVPRALDMGCGSGILAMAMARLWRAPVTAVDIDGEAVRVTRENARLNGVSKYVRAGAGNGYAAPILARAEPFDLVAANILARPLRRMAPALAQALQPGGYAVLSGLLKWQAASVLAAHRGQGLHLVARYPVGEWQTLVLRK